MQLTNQPSLTVRPLAKILDKEPANFQRKDLLDVIKNFDIYQLSLHYTGLDGKLKEVKVPISTLKYADMILAQGERIDGSSVFKGVVDPGKSDLYIQPVYRTAFLSPFENHTLGIQCRFLNRDGELAEFAPDNILAKSHARFQQKTGLTFNALGELEFFLIYQPEHRNFCGVEQRGYHQAAPFIKCGPLVTEMARIIDGLTGAVKYAHSEVGYIENLESIDPEIDGKRCEQFEIEFLPRRVEDMADYLALSKWVVRNVANRWGATATFTPKLQEGSAGNGLHFHMELMKNGRNVMLDDKGELSVDATKLIGGLCQYAPSLTAFGNSVSSAYLRLVPNQEAPTKVFWSEQNRNALIRVPLGWRNISDFSKKVNLSQQDSYQNDIGRQTVEIRSPDGSARIHLTLAGIVAAAEHGLTDPRMLEYAEKRHVGGRPTKEELISFESLPASCAESADALAKERERYERDGVFPKEIVDYTIKKLLKEDDRNINERLSQFPAEKRLKATRAIMHKDLHAQ